MKELFIQHLTENWWLSARGFCTTWCIPSFSQFCKNIGNTWKLLPEHSPCSTVKCLGRPYHSVNILLCANVVQLQWNSCVFWYQLIHICIFEEVMWCCFHQCGPMSSWVHFQANQSKLPSPVSLRVLGHKAIPETNCSSASSLLESICCRPGTSDKCCLGQDYCLRKAMSPLVMLAPQTQAQATALKTKLWKGEFEMVLGVHACTFKTSKTFWNIWVPCWCGLDVMELTCQQTVPILCWIQTFIFGYWTAKWQNVPISFIAFVCQGTHMYILTFLPLCYWQILEVYPTHSLWLRHDHLQVILNRNRCRNTFPCWFTWHEHVTRLEPKLTATLKSKSALEIKYTLWSCSQHLCVFNSTKWELYDVSQKIVMCIIRSGWRELLTSALIGTVNSPACCRKNYISAHACLTYIADK